MQDKIAFHMLEVWLLLVGCTPLDRDSAELRDYGRHRVWTVAARTGSDFDFDRAEATITMYISEWNKLPDVPKFTLYSLDLYECQCGCGEFLYCAIAQ